MNIRIYRDRLRRHDWYYQMSHDTRRYDAGKEEEDNLKKLAEGKKTYLRAYEQRYRKMFPKKKSR